MPDLGYYILDVVLLVMLARLVRNSRKVELESSVGRQVKWIVPVFFVVIAVVGLVRYEGVFRWVQTVVLLVMGWMCYNMKSGLSPEGVVSMGSLTKYEKAGPLRLKEYDCCIFYKVPHRGDGMLYFEEEQFADLRKYCRDHGIRVQNV